MRYKPGKNAESSHELLFAQFDCEHGNPVFVTRTVAVESAGVTKRPCAIPLKEVIGSPIWQRRGSDWRIVGVMCDIQRPRTRTHLVDVVGAEHCTAKKSSATAAAAHKLAQLAEANGLTQPVWIVGVRLTESLLERIKTGLPSVMHHPDLHKVGDTEEVAAKSKPKKTKKVASHKTPKGS